MGCRFITDAFSCSPAHATLSPEWKSWKIGHYAWASRFQPHTIQLLPAFSESSCHKAFFVMLSPMLNPHSPDVSVSTNFLGGNHALKPRRQRSHYGFISGAKWCKEDLTLWFHHLTPWMPCSAVMRCPTALCIGTDQPPHEYRCHHLVYEQVVSTFPTHFSHMNQRSKVLLTGGDFVRRLLHSSFVVLRSSWLSRNRHLTGMLLFVLDLAHAHQLLFYSLDTRSHLCVTFISSWSLRDDMVTGLPKWRWTHFHQDVL